MMWRSALRRWLLRIGNLVVLHAANPSDYHDTGMMQVLNIYIFIGRNDCVRIDLARFDYNTIELM